MTQLSSVEDQLSDLLGLGDLRPLEGGRTNRVWVCDDRVVKLFQEGRNTPLFDNSPELEWIALAALNGLKVAPEPVCLQVTPWGKVLVYKHISGDHGYESLADAAALLGQLHQIEAPKNLPKTPIGEEVISQGNSMLPKTHFLHDLRPPAQGAGRLCFVHRDPVYSNFISGASGLWLVDWQCPGAGDPVEDIAHFISPSMNHLYREKTLSSKEIDEFLAFYPHPLTAQSYKAYGHIFHWRMACYCAWQVGEGNADYVPALKIETEFLRNWPYF